jgi:hypothetical protein
MKHFTTFLREIITSCIDCYTQYFKKTLGVALAYTTLCYLVMVLLLHYSHFSEKNTSKQISLLSYFFYRYSFYGVYSLVDLSKTVFIFFVSLFSLGFWRQQVGVDGTADYSLFSFIRNLKVSAAISLLGMVLICAAIDFGLFSLNKPVVENIGNNGLARWLWSLIFIARVYLPLILFSLTIHYLNFGRPLFSGAKKILFLFIALWCYNAFAAESLLFIRNHIFSLLLIPFGHDWYFCLESILGLPLVAFYFLGFHVTMSMSLQLLNEAAPFNEGDVIEEVPTVKEDPLDMD